MVLVRTLGIANTRLWFSQRGYQKNRSSYGHCRFLGKCQSPKRDSNHWQLITFSTKSSGT